MFCYSQDFKALGIELAAGIAGLTPKENAEFESQRKDAILEASKTGDKKVFGAGSKDIKEAENTKRRREPRGGDRQNSEEPAPTETVNGGGKLTQILNNFSHPVKHSSTRAIELSCLIFLNEFLNRC